MTLNAIETKSFLAHFSNKESKHKTIIIHAWLEAGNDVSLVKWKSTKVRAVIKGNSEHSTVPVYKIVSFIYKLEKRSVCCLEALPIVCFLNVCFEHYIKN